MSAITIISVRITKQALQHALKSTKSRGHNLSQELTLHDANNNKKNLNHKFHQVLVGIKADLKASEHELIDQVAINITLLYDCPGWNVWPCSYFIATCFPREPEALM